MKKYARLLGITLIFLFMLAGCGGLRYSQVAPEAAGIHPKKVGMLPVDLGTYEEARGVIDSLIVTDLIRRKWFEDVVDAEAVNRQILFSEDVRKLTVDYLAKLKTVSYSDPEMSNKIGALLHIDAFLVVNVDYWLYTVEGKDKVGKVGLGIKMVDAASGKILWKASHHLVESYWMIKPDLPKVAKNLVAMMIDEMPH
jgi:hypothetical protein